jgi:hypothetical protein
MYRLNLVGIFSKNRLEWMILDISNALYKRVSKEYYLINSKKENLFIDIWFILIRKKKN